MTSTLVGEQTKATSPTVVAVIVNYRTAELVEQCLIGLRAQRADIDDLRVLIVDGGSEDGSDLALATLVDRPEFKGWTDAVPLRFNGGFGWANNEAFRLVARRNWWPRYFWVINPDAVAQPGALHALIQWLDQRPVAAVAGSLILDRYGREAGSSFAFPSLAAEFARGLNAPKLARWLRLAPTPTVSTEAPIRCDWVSGASFAIRSEAVCRAGAFDEGFFLYFEEVEWMARLARQHWEVWHIPASRVAHIGGAATGVADGASSARRLPRYWHVSRWRFFTLYRSSTYAFGASLAWAMGRLIGAGRHALGGGRAHMQAPFEASDMVSTIINDRRVQPPAIGRADGPVGAKPAWVDRP